MSNASGGYSYSYKNQKKPEARSWDRVHFTIPAQHLGKKNIRECIEETLGIRSAQTATLANTDTDLHIVARPSQFARFIVLRHIKYGEQNNMACLNMRLVVPVTQDDPSWDVSGNPNTASGSGE